MEKKITCETHQLLPHYVCEKCLTFLCTECLPIHQKKVHLEVCSLIPEYARDVIAQKYHELRKETEGRKASIDKSASDFYSGVSGLALQLERLNEKLLAIQRDTSSLIDMLKLFAGAKDWDNISSALIQPLIEKQLELENAIKSKDIAKMIELSYGIDKELKVPLPDDKEKAFMESFKAMIQKERDDPHYTELSAGMTKLKSVLNELTTLCIHCSKKKLLSQIKKCPLCKPAVAICAECFSTQQTSAKCSFWSLDPTTKGAHFSLSNYNLTATASSGAQPILYLAGDTPFIKGIYKFEVTYTGCTCRGWHLFGVIPEAKFKELRNANTQNITSAITGIGLNGAISGNMTGVSSISSGQTMIIQVNLIKGELVITGPNATAATGALDTSIPYLPCFNCCYCQPSTLIIKHLS